MPRTKAKLEEFVWDKQRRILYYTKDDAMYERARMDKRVLGDGFVIEGTTATLEFDYAFEYGYDPDLHCYGWWFKPSDYRCREEHKDIRLFIGDPA